MATDRPDYAGLERLGPIDPPADQSTELGAARRPEEPPTPPMFGRIWVKLVVSLVIAVAFVWALQRGGLPILPPREALARVEVASVLFYLPLLVAWQFIRAARWRHLLRSLEPEVSLDRAATVSFIGYGAILILPLRAGELVRPYLIRDRRGISMAAAMGTIGAERIIDGLLLTGVLGICLQIGDLLDPLPDHIGNLQIPVVLVPVYAYTALAAFVGAFALMTVFHLRPRLGRVLLERTLGLVSKRLAKRVSDVVGRMADGLRFLRSPRHVGPFLVETLAYWTLNVVALLVLARGAGLPGFDLAHACVVMGVLSIGVVVPAGPGLFGAFQASIYAALALFYQDDVVLGSGAAFLFLLYILEGSWQVLAAGVCLLRARGMRRKLAGGAFER